MKKPIYAFLAIFFLMTSWKTKETENLRKSAKADFEIKIDDYLNQVIKRQGIPGFGLAIVQNDSIIYRNNYGYANIEHNVPVTDNSIFRLYSLTKLTVATAIFKLVEQNKLALDEPISKYIDDLPNSWKSIEIEYLLKHSSGLPDIVPIPDFQEYSENDIKEYIYNKPLYFNKGEYHNYNQTNFWLLQRILEKVTGNKIEEFILNNQFDGGNKNVFFSSDSQTIVENRATPYFPSKNGELIITHPHIDRYFYAANGLNITVGEFIKWNKKLNDNELLQKSSKEKMLQGFTYSNTNRIWTYGWNKHIINDHISYGFSGSLVTAYRNFPDDNLSIILFGNGFEYYFDIENVINQIANYVDKDIIDLNSFAHENLLENIIKKDIEGFKDQLTKLEKLESFKNFNFEQNINGVGYNLLNIKEYKLAIKVFELNANKNPKSSNAYDSLADAYERNKDFENAILNYSKAKSLSNDKKYKSDLDKKIKKLSKRTNANSSKIQPDKRVFKIDKQLDSLFNFSHSNGMFNGAILVAKNDSILYKKSFGYANEETKEKITPESVFYIASISKQFTAMGIMMLQEQGKLSFDDKIKDLFPDYPGYLENTTIRQLLNHTSGITDTNYYKLTNPSNEDVFRTLVSQDSLEFKSGTTFRYSNTGYVLLALIIEKISNKPIDEFFKLTFFEPLGMKNTIATKAVAGNSFKKVEGYNLLGKKIGYNLSVIGPGGIYSTINDLEKWNKALNTHRFVSENTLNQAYTNGRLKKGYISLNINNQEYGYGFGWIPYNKNGKKYVKHEGTVESYRSLIKKNLTDGYDYIFLTNQGGKLAINELTSSIDNILEKSEYKVPKIPIANKILQEFGKNDTNTAITIIKSVISENPNDYGIDENDINRLSYTYLKDSQIIKAIEIFKLNTELHPNSANAFDSLAEGYFVNKEFKLSKENYQKSLELNPKNENAKVMIERIRKETAEK